jgi:hypothetical protein
MFYHDLIASLLRIIRLKTLKLKSFKHRTIHYPPLFLITLNPPACFQPNLLENWSIPSRKHTVAILTDQICAKTENNRKLYGEIFLHPSH